MEKGLSEKEGLSEKGGFLKKTKFEGHTLRRCHESKAEREINPGSSTRSDFALFFCVSTKFQSNINIELSTRGSFQDSLESF